MKRSSEKEAAGAEWIVAVGILIFADGGGRCSWGGRLLRSGVVVDFREKRGRDEVDQRPRFVGD